MSDETPVFKVGPTIVFSTEVMMSDPAFAARHSYLLPDPNPFPQFRLFTLRRKAKR